MKPFKQGVFSRYCSVYSTLNSLQSLGIKLKYQQWQQLYDYLLYEINACGADHKRLEVIFQYASEWLEKHCKLKLVFQRPFWNKRISLNELVECAKQQIADKKAIHLRIRSSLIDHYTVIKRITKDRICFYDSSDLPDIPLKYVSTNDSKKYQICFRQVYFLSLEAV